MFTVTIVNQALSSLQGGSLDTTLTLHNIPLKKKKLMKPQIIKLHFYIFQNPFQIVSITCGAGTFYLKMLHLTFLTF